MPVVNIDRSFPIDESELELAYRHPAGDPALSFAKSVVNPNIWAQQCTQKLKELLGLSMQHPSPGPVTRLRDIEVGKITVQALVMDVQPHLSIPAYLLVPHDPIDPRRAIMCLHGHGRVEPCLGLSDDYHHQFAWELAKQGHIVLAPELRGFGVLRDMTRHLDGYRLDYWVWGGHVAFTLVTDAFVHGSTLMGETIDDLLRWEHWLRTEMGIATIDSAGMSYGGDLAIMYPVFSDRVDRIFASGTLGSFTAVFGRCYNAAAHCIPQVLKWMDRSDIAGLNAPRPILLHWGEQDTPGPDNYSAAYNETVEPSLEELLTIYRAFDAEDQVQIHISPDLGHEIDIPALIEFMSAG